MNKHKEALGKFHLKKTFSATGVIGSESYQVGGVAKLNVVLEGVGSGNVVKLYGRIKQQTTWKLVSTITGATDSTVVTFDTYDEARFECDTYQAGGSPTLLVAGSFYL